MGFALSRTKVAMRSLIMIPVVFLILMPLTCAWRLLVHIKDAFVEWWHDVRLEVFAHLLVTGDVWCYVFQGRDRAEERSVKEHEELVKSFIRTMPKRRKVNK